MRTRYGPAVRWLAAAVAAIAVVGCAIGSGTGGDGSAPREPVDLAGMAGDERSAVDATDAYWRAHFAELSDRPYRSPQVAGGYQGQNGPSCGGTPSVPFNAFYCLPGDFLAWDENLMAAGYQRIGDAWVYLIISHEWGHAIQARLDRTQVSVAAELQADCLAGATLQGAARDRLLSIEPGDAEEIAETLSAVADDYPWTNQRDHGDARQRIAAFNRGASDGPVSCTT